MRLRITPILVILSSLAWLQSHRTSGSFRKLASYACYAPSRSTVHISRRPGLTSLILIPDHSQIRVLNPSFFSPEQCKNTAARGLDDVQVDVSQWTLSAVHESDTDVNLQLDACAMSPDRRWIVAAMSGLNLCVWSVKSP